MKTVLNLMLLSGLGYGPAAAQSPPVWSEREAFLMGTVLRVQVAAADRPSGMRAMEEVFQEVRRLEGVLSTWTPGSEIARINTAAVGDEVEVSAELMCLLLEAEQWSRRTGGAFDPAVGALIDAWDLRATGRLPAPTTLAEARRATGVHLFGFDPSTRRVRVHTQGAWLDTGGFGKGAALRAAERVLREHGVDAALLDFGGQVLTYGDAPAGEVAWHVDVAHPTARAEPVATLRIPGGLSVSTSAQSERFVEVEGERFGHVLDPRAGWPVPAWGSVTVVAEDPIAADVLSTALLVMGADEGRRWAAKRAEGVLFLEVRGGKVEASWNSAFERYGIDQPIIEES